MKKVLILFCAVLFQFTAARAQTESKGSVVIWPSLPLCERLGLIRIENSNGTEVRLPDYDKCKSNADISLIISELSEELNNRGFVAQSFAYALDELKIRKQEDEALAAEYGILKSNAIDDLPNYALGDMNAIVTYDIQTEAGRKQCSFSIECIDVYSGRTVASATTLSNPSSSSTDKELIRDAYVQKLNEVSTKLSNAVKDIKENGRFVNLFVRISESAGLKMSHVIGDSTIEMHIKKYIHEHAQGNVITNYRTFPNKASFEGTRISYLGDAGIQTASEFLTKVAIHLSTLGVNADVIPTGGNGRATLIITGLNK